ncbi:hypothetical protein BC826DRAFT_1177102 [Russula brevipes]|nr:hypothetical protein BC826DRAFT_1177102 [Russula brevipes]
MINGCATNKQPDYRSPPLRQFCNLVICKYPRIESPPVDQFLLFAMPISTCSSVTDSALHHQMGLLIITTVRMELASADIRKRQPGELWLARGSFWPTCAGGVEADKAGQNASCVPNLRVQYPLPLRKPSRRSDAKPSFSALPDDTCDLESILMARCSSKISQHTAKPSPGCSIGANYLLVVGDHAPVLTTGMSHLMDTAK